MNGCACSGCIREPIRVRVSRSVSEKHQSIGRAPGAHIAAPRAWLVVLAVLTPTLGCYHTVHPIKPTPAPAKAPAKALVEPKPVMPSSVSVGKLSLSGPHRVGRVPFWEGPDNEGRDLTRTGDSVVLFSHRGDESCLVELWSVGSEVALSWRVWKGRLNRAASDGRGRLVVHGVPATGGRSVASRRPIFLTTDIRRPGQQLRPFKLPQVPGFEPDTMLCGSPGSITGWPRQTKRYLPVQMLPGPPRALPFNAAVVKPLRCAYGHRSGCSSLLHKSDKPQIWLLSTRCGTSASTIKVPKPGPAVRLHPSGLRVEAEHAQGKSRLRVLKRDEDPSELSFDDWVYALTFWDAETLLLHVARTDARSVFHTRVVVLDTRGHQRAQLDTDPFRGAAHRVPVSQHPPERGNGLPLAMRVGQALVLIAGDGVVWAWRGQ